MQRVKLSDRPTIPDFVTLLREMLEKEIGEQASHNDAISIELKRLIVLEIAELSVTNDRRAF